MKTILVPTNFSETATNAIYYAAALTNQLNGKLVIVHIMNLPLEVVETGTTGLIDKELEIEFRQELRRVAAAVRENTGYQFEIETHCQFGKLPESLNEQVIYYKADLVVMGTNGATNFLDRMVGTNTSEFINIAVCPVLAIPMGFKFKPIKTLVYAADFENSETVFLQQLFSFVQPLKTDVTIVNVITESQLDIYPDKQVMLEIYKKFPYDNFCIVQFRNKDIVKGINNFIEGDQADVLAISIHDRSFFEKLFHNSISEKIVYEIKIPLLSLPDKSYLKTVPIS